ncbi:transcriptional regulator PadR-like family protein [Ruminiclostridium hungatei]|uniref:Transcriptional regulator PadR-like family protein n=1 Tax=Ruminiclostridium hungatei TaxID=48256 RepID=A0A1V4SE62_RUMHU|nr:PadR family transcriptional regulator [Ruminiclostridium hungatei]OPX42199.1 transcriptional regulator PadR-like family protein [Ruminiclostridium hungatei]
MKNKTMYAVLGVLSLLGPMSGYDIKKFCDKSISYFWNENFGHLYPVLARLEADGLIERDTEAEDSRKKNYKITPKGVEVLKDWLTLPVEYQPERSELLLKLSFGTKMELEATLSMLEAARERNELKYKQLSSIHSYYLGNEEAKSKPQYPYWLVTLRYGINSLEASLKWFGETMEFLRSYESK